MTLGSPEATRGAVSASLSGLVVVIGLSIGDGNPAIAFLAVVLLPFAISYISTKRLSSAFVLLWMTEQLFGMSGSWIAFGPIPGRALLLAVVLIGVAFDIQYQRNIARLSSSTHQWVLGYSLLLPSLFLLWGVGIKGTEIEYALSDVLRFFGLLAFYPVCCFVRENAELLKGWLIGASILLSILFIVMTIGPVGMRYLMVDNWVYNGQGGAPAIAYIRVTYEPLVYTFLVLFYGVFVLLRPRHSSSIGFWLLLIGILPIALNFLRGPLVALAIVIATILITRLGDKESATKVVKYTPLIAAGLALAVYLVIQNPLAFDKIDQLTNTIHIDDIIGQVRQTQIELILNEWSQAPILGQGVGASLIGYSLSSGQSLEFQWGMVLYRIGIVGLALVVTPFLFVAQYLWFNRTSPGDSRRSPGILTQSVAATLIALAIASIFNPYLASSITIALFVIFNALKINEKSQSRNRKSRISRLDPRDGGVSHGGVRQSARS